MARCASIGDRAATNTERWAIGGPPAPGAPGIRDPGDPDGKAGAVANDRSPVNRVLGAIVGPAVGAVDPDALLERVDIETLIQRIDVDALISRVDLDALLLRIDVDALMARIDVDALVRRVDLDALMADVDVDALVGRIDLDAMIDRVDLPALVSRAGIDDIVSDAATGIARRTIDLLRRQLLGIDTVILRVVDRLLGRPRPTGPQAVAGRPAGPLARLAAIAVDWVLVGFLFTLTVRLSASLIELFTRQSVRPGDGNATGWGLAFVGWLFLYWWASLAVAGRTPGKALIGLRVVAKDGSPVGPGAAAVRTIVLPFSCILALGLIPGVVGRSRRALHDLVSGTREAVDWGQRDAALPSPLARWLEQHATDTAPNDAAGSDPIRSP